MHEDSASNEEDVAMKDNVYDYASERRKEKIN